MTLFPNENVYVDSLAVESLVFKHPHVHCAEFNLQSLVLWIEMSSRLANCHCDWKVSGSNPIIGTAISPLGP